MITQLDKPVGIVSHHRNEQPAFAEMNRNSIVVQDVRIFTGDEVIERGFVVAIEGQIVEVGRGSFSEASNPEVEVISRPGHTLIPGLIDCHIHALSGNVNSIEQSLRFGVTTVCDMHSEPSDNRKLIEVSSHKPW